MKSNPKKAQVGFSKADQAKLAINPQEYRLFQELIWYMVQSDKKCWYGV